MFGIVNVNDFGDDGSAIQAAIDYATQEFADPNAPVHRRTHVFLPPGKYVLEQPLNLCNCQDVIIEGASPRWTLIEARCTGQAAVEALGSMEMIFRNLQIFGHASFTPAVAFWTGRSTERNNSSQILFDNCYVRGDFSEAGWYVMSSESNTLWHCASFLHSGKASVYVSNDHELNVSSIYTTPKFNQGTYNLLLDRCNVSSKTTADEHRALYVGPGVNFSHARDCYFVSYAQPVIELVAGKTGVVLENCVKEGSSPIYLKLSANPEQSISKFRNISIRNGGPGGGEMDYAILADDEVVVEGLRIEEWNNTHDIKMDELRQAFAQNWANYNACVTWDIDKLYYSTIHTGLNNVVQTGLMVESQILL